MRKKIQQTIAQLSAQEAFALYQSMDSAIKAEIDRNGVSGRIVLFQRYKELLAEYISTLHQAERQKERARINPGAPAPIHTSIPQFYLCLDMDKPCCTVGFWITDIDTGLPVPQRFYISNQ